MGQAGGCQARPWRFRAGRDRMACALASCCRAAAHAHIPTQDRTCTLCDATSHCHGSAARLSLRPRASWHKNNSTGESGSAAHRGFPRQIETLSRGPGMTGLLADYLPLIVFIGVALFIATALLVVPFLVAFKSPDPEKLSAYECGFNAFDDARMKFDVRFYLVAILFIIFDLEVAFLFPWAITFGDLGWFGFWSMIVFLGVLTVGFVYEWRKGALEWD
ncbi:NADH-quinone oxidoreductase subunit A [Methylobacterium brachiatum]|nr:NADH-quinone oxidoreductase subunit A [Methylobacterium brachiatum]